MLEQRVRVKICGITNLADAEAAGQCGADGLRFNLYARSPRGLTPENAVLIIRALPPFVELVALFVNESFDCMQSVTHDLQRVRTIQYHGRQLAPCPTSRFVFIPAFAVENADRL